MSNGRGAVPLLRREYLGYTGLVGRLTDDSVWGIPTWKEGSSTNTEFPVTIASKVIALKNLFRKNVNYPTLMGPFDKTPVHLICSVNSPGQVEALHLLCSANKAAVNVLDRNQRTPLHHALSRQNIEYHAKVNNGIHLVLLIKELINFGANINALDVHGISPLHLAMHGGRLMELPTILKMFVDAGADLLQPVPARHRTFRFLEYIEGDGEDIMSDPDITTVIHLVCRMVGLISIEAMKAIITPENVNLRESYDRTPLHDLMVSIGQAPAELLSALDDIPEEEAFIQKLTYLLDLGADVNAQDVDRATPICIALQKYRSPISSQAVDTLLSHGAVTNVQFSDEAVTPMHLLCRNFNHVISYFLPRFLDAGADINARDRRNQTPLFYALKNGNCGVDVLQYICRMGADIMAIDAEGSNSLHIVAGEQEPKSANIVAYLVERGCDINRKNIARDTPLLVYLRSGDDPEFVQTLISLGADAEATNVNDGSTALHIVCKTSRWRECSKKIVQLIITAGANVNAQDHYGSTPLLYEIQGSSNGNRVRDLLRAGADPNAFGDEAPLHVAASDGNPQLTKLLLAFRADINVLDIDGRTPLHRATSSLRDATNETLMTLIHGGASPSVMDHSDRTPVMYMTYKTSHLFISYIALLISTGRYSLTEEEKEFFGEVLHYFSTYFDKCLKEAPRLKDFLVGNITLTEFLVGPADRARRWARNPEIKDVLRRTCSFELFSRFIEEKLAFLRHLNDLEDKALISLNLLCPGNLPLVVAEKILSELTYQEKLSLSEIDWD